VEKAVRVQVVEEQKEEVEMQIILQELENLQVVDEEILLRNKVNISLT
jgi:hypothetical protein